MITGLVQHPDKIEPGLRVVDIQKAAGEKDDILVGMGLPDFFQLLPEALFGMGALAEMPSLSSAKRVTGLSMPKFFSLAGT